MEVAWIRMKACRRSWIVVEEHFDGFLLYGSRRDARHKSTCTKQFPWALWIKKSQYIVSYSVRWFLISLIYLQSLYISWRRSSGDFTLHGVLSLET